MSSGPCLILQTQRPSPSANRAAPNLHVSNTTPDAHLQAAAASDIAAYESRLPRRRWNPSLRFILSSSASLSKTRPQQSQQVEPVTTAIEHMRKSSKFQTLVTNSHPNIDEAPQSRSVTHPANLSPSCVFSIISARGTARTPVGWLCQITTRRTRQREWPRPCSVTVVGNQQDGGRNACGDGQKLQTWRMGRSRGAARRGKKWTHDTWARDRRGKGMEEERTRGETRRNFGKREGEGEGA